MGSGLTTTRALLVDTNVFIDFLRGYPEAITLVNARSSQIIVSSIVVAELYAGVKGEREENILRDFVSLFRVVDVDAEIARMAGLYKRDYGKSHGIGLADAILAATAGVENAVLITLNTKHYPMLKNLEPPYKKQ